LVAVFALLSGLVLQPTVAHAAVTPATNPSLPTTCGLDVAIVLDLSGSLSDTAVQQSKTAAKGFVTALEGTPSGVGIYTFASTANPGNALDLTSVATAAGAEAVRDHIDGVTRPSNNRTNWKDGFDQIPTGKYDMIVFVTDGQPNEPYWDSPLDSGITAANAHKNAGTFVMGLGVGSGIDEGNIQKISGPVKNTDYYMIDNYSQLSAQMKEIASKNCKGTVTVLKQVKKADGSQAPASGWTFGTSTANVSPASGVTGNDGTLNFSVSYADNQDSRSVTIAETSQPGYVLSQQNGKNAVCVDRATGNNVPVTNSGGTGFTLDVKQSGVVTCTVINLEKAADLSVKASAKASFDRTYDWQVEKKADTTKVEAPIGSTATVPYTVTVTPSAAQDSNFRITGTATVTNPNATQATGATITAEFPGATCTVTNGTGVTVPANGTASRDYSCDLPSGSASTSGNVTVTATWDTGDLPGSTPPSKDTVAVDFATVSPTVTNGSATLTDSLRPGWSKTFQATDGKQTVKYEIEFTADNTCQTHTNVATLTVGKGKQTSQATVQVCGTGTDLTVNVTGQARYDRTYTWDVEKKAGTTKVEAPIGDKATVPYTITVTPSQAQDSGFVITGETKVSNPNAIAATGVNVTVTYPGADCVVTDGTGVTVPAKGNVTRSYTCTLTSGTAEVADTVTVTADWSTTELPGTTPPATGTLDIDFADVTPTVSNDTATLTDSLRDGWSKTYQAVDGQQVESYSLDFTADNTCRTYSNVATLTVGQPLTAKQAAQAADQAVLTSEASVQVCGSGTNLTVNVTGQGSFDRSYEWSLNKQSDIAKAEQYPGSTTTVHYTVTVTPTAKDGNFVITGTAKVSNPNAIDATGVSVTASFPGADCVVTDGTGVTVPAKGNVTRSYTCTLTSGTADVADTVTVTADWSTTELPGTTPPATGTLNVDFADVTPAVSHDSATLTDNLRADWSKTYTAADGVKVVKYALTFTVASGCAVTSNVASLAVKDGSTVTSQADVTLCGTTPPLAQTGLDGATPWVLGLGVLAIALGGLLVARGQLRRRNG